MPPESLERLADFAASGGRGIFVERLPEAAPGVSRQVEQTARLRAALRKFWGDREPAPGETVNVGDGKVILAPGRVAVLSEVQAAVEPDCRIVEAGDNTEEELKLARANVGFLHRRLGSVDFYFLSNISNQPQKLRVQFAAGPRKPTRWNSEMGEPDVSLVYSFAPRHDGTGQETIAQLLLESLESCFVVFAESQDQPTITRTNFWGPLQIEKSGKQSVIRGRVKENGIYWFESPKGKRHQLAVKGVPEPSSFNGPWTLRLGEGPPVELAALRSWNELPEGKTYSGWGTYETSFDIAEPGRDLDWMIDLGRVHETAEAELNGVALGAAWKGARRLACRDALKLGRNHLIIRVANLWIHHMKSLPPPDVSAVAETYGIRWGRYGEIDQKELPPSGLLGPVRLIPLKRWTLKI